MRNLETKSVLGTCAIFAKCNMFISCGEYHRGGGEDIVLRCPYFDLLLNVSCGALPSSLCYASLLPSDAIWLINMDWLELMRALTKEVYT